MKIHELGLLTKDGGNDSKWQTFQHRFLHLCLTN